MAEERDVDLVEIAPTAEPPVCKLMDYGKFKYREQKKAHEAKLKQKQIQLKEIKFRPGTDEGDYQIKLRNLIRFLEEGDKAKVTLRFRGREMAHQEFGVRLLERVRNDLEPFAVVEQFPKLEGRQMIMVLGPRKGGKKKDERRRRRRNEGRTGARQERDAEHLAVRLQQPRSGAGRKQVCRGREALRRGATRHRIGRKVSHAQDEDEEGAAKRFRIRAGGKIKRCARLPAPHPHQEAHQAEAPSARDHRGDPRRTRARCASMLPYD